MGQTLLTALLPKEEKGKGKKKKKVAQMCLFLQALKLVAAQLFMVGLRIT